MLKGIFGHFKTIMRHKWEVFKISAKVGIPIRGLLHDLSKFSPSEFFVGAKYYTGKRSPNEGERKDFGFSTAWIHHKGIERHHFEHWRDYDPNTGIERPVEMPVIFLKEMFCDRVAASKTYMGKDYTDCEPLKYFLKAKGKRSIGEKTSDRLELFLTVLAEKGEKEAFKFVREYRIKDADSK